jgi:hypothetical protein
LDVLRRFDLELDNLPTFVPFLLPALPEKWSVGVIVGASGTGKTSLLAAFNPVKVTYSPDESVLDVFERLGVGVIDSAERLAAAGLGSVPSWPRSMSVLSNGERFRAELALALTDGAAIDEYTSVVSRSVARSASMAVRKYVDRTGVGNLVFASCHYDIVEPLRPDWIINTDDGVYTDETTWQQHRWWVKYSEGAVGSITWKKK